MKNPFTIGLIEREEDFCNRARERKELLQHARNGSKVVICSPRRYGKSSLVKIVLRDLAKEGMLTTYVDLFPVSSEQDFVVRLASSILKDIGKGEDPRSPFEKIKGIFGRFIPTIDVGPEGFSISVKYDHSTGTTALLDDIMEGLHNYTRKNGLSALVVLDEFQEITELAQAKKIEGILRTHIQSHGEISYFYVGSRRRILQDMFNNKSRPFYKSAFFYPMKEIPISDFTPYVVGRFKETGKTCAPDIADEIYNRVRGYPYYVQKLASIVWDATEGQCSAAVVAQAFRRLVESEAVDFEGIWGSLSLSQKSALKAFSQEETSAPYSKGYLERHGLSIGGTQGSIKTLLKKDLIEKNEEGSYRLTDPVMVAWLRS